MMADTMMDGTLSQGQTATVRGGATRVDTSDLHRAAALLKDLAHDLTARAVVCQEDLHRAATELAPVPLCPAATMPGQGQILHHRRQDQAGLLFACLHEAGILSERLTVLARRCTDLSDLLIRAEGVYRESESLVSRAFGTLLGLLPGAGAMAGLLLAPTIAGAAGLKAGTLAPGASRLLQEADPLVQPGMSLLARSMGPAGTAFDVNDAARLLSPVSAAAQNLYQGDRLTVSRVIPGKGGGIGASTDVSSALANLDRLGDINRTRVPYSTIAVQKYREDDGTVHWLLLVPGTRGERDTPIGWAQNVELMSSDNRQRLHADSSRLALEALRRSGVRPGQSVAVVGHSQGGIVAASLAAGDTGYDITHIVTAGSPIAGHPIPSSTWVTSVEDRGELVSRLDGRDNPTRPGWVSVDGTLGMSRSRQAPGEEVEGTGGRAALTHGMNYQRATWEDARRLGNPAVEESDRHFRGQIQGRLVSTQYFTGRMFH